LALSSYLDQFRSGLREVQSQQILSLLSQEKDKGNITTVEEFRTRLEELTAELQAETIQPTLKLFLAEFTELIDSESFNFMMERIQDDLRAAYQEMNDIDEVLAAHENIINNVVLTNLELAVNDLESKIESFEFLNKNRDGFDNTIFNTFRGTQNNRTANDQIVVFLDPKTGVSSSTPAFRANVDTIGEKLLLTTSIDNELLAASVRQVFDFEAIGSELNVEFEDSNINNIIDNTAGTFWVQSVMLSQPRNETGVITKLEIDLGGVKSVNFIQIEPLTLYPIEIIGITIIDPNNQSIPILTQPVEANSNNRFFFNTASAKKIILKIRNRNYSQVQFTTKAGSPIPELTRDLTNVDNTIQNVSEELAELVSSPLLTAALNVPDFPGEKKSYYEYLIGFDNIRLGLGQFSDVSIFVSKTELVNGLGQTAIRVNEKRPIGAIDSNSIEYTKDTYPAGFDDYFHGSLEYYMVKRDFSSSGALQDAVVFSIPPLGVQRIRHERLQLTARSTAVGATPNIGFLQFFTLYDGYHPVDNPTGTLRVFRNGQLLPVSDSNIGPNSALETDGWFKNYNLSQDVPGQPAKMSFAIQIQNPNPNNIYTVSYTPAASTTNVIPTTSNLSAYIQEQGLQIVDLTGGLKAWLGKDNIVYFKENQSGTSIAYSTINLVVVLRRNSANVNLTPILEDYLIATGSRDPSKFGG